MTHKKEKVTGVIVELASEFLTRESNMRALITVTRTETSPDLKRAYIFLSVLPEAKEDEVLKFAKRKRSAYRKYVIKRSFLRPIPLFDFVIDEGEKNRRRIDELTKKHQP